MLERHRHLDAVHEWTADLEMLTGPREPSPEELRDLEHLEAERRHLLDLPPTPDLTPVSLVPPSTLPLGGGTPSWKAA